MAIRKQFIPTRRAKLLALFVLALMVRAAAALLFHGSGIALDGGDYKLYWLGAQQIIEHGNLANSLFLARPPLFPLMIAALNGSDIAIIAVNALLGSALAPMCYLLARRLGLVERFALLAGAVVALDLGSAVYAVARLSEPLANFFFLLAVLLLLAGLAEPRRARAVGIGALAGAALALSALARPAAYLAWVILGIYGMVANRRRWDTVAVFAAAALAGVAAWTLHNGAVFGNYTFNTVGPYTMLYYRAASVEKFATGKTIEEVYTDLSAWVEARLDRGVVADANTMHTHLAATPEVQRALSDVALEVFLAHPLAYLATIPQGLLRMFLWTQVLPAWLVPADVLWNGLFVFGAAAGWGAACLRRRLRLCGLVFLVSAYYTAGTLLVKVSAIDTRFRSMLAPFMAAVFAYAVELLVSKYKTNRAPPRST